MAYPGYGGYGGQMPGMPGQGMPGQGMPGQGMPGQGMPPHGMPGGPMGGPMGGAPPQAGYGSYGGGFPGSYGAPPPAANDPMWASFTAIAGQDGEVDAEELQRCLTQSGFTGSYARKFTASSDAGHAVSQVFITADWFKSAFSLDTCRIMIAMLDRDFTGKMGFSEFKELFTALNGWKQNFMMFDQDRSGTVEPHEMNQALNTMGYRVSPQSLNAIIKRYNKGGRIYFDDYVACCVKLRTLTENFRRRDTMQQGAVTFQYDDFILCTMSI